MNIICLVSKIAQWHTPKTFAHPIPHGSYASGCKCTLFDLANMHGMIIVERLLTLPGRQAGVDRLQYGGCVLATKKSEHRQLTINLCKPIE